MAKCTINFNIRFVQKFYLIQFRISLLVVDVNFIVGW
jgi:hypothetical protein